jgi:arabinosaccharide transport system substrate-binding protein
MPMSFHLGYPILILCLLAAATGVVVESRPAPVHHDLNVWVFSDDEADAFRRPAPDGSPSLLDRFTHESHESAAVGLVAQRALDARLLSLFMSGSTTASVPDLVEIDLASVGKYFRPPVADIGLLPLNGFLSQSGELQKIIPSRLATWSKGGLIFGVPRDVHPVTLIYRKDLFDEAGVDLQSPRTWPEFQEACLRFQSYWASHGRPDRKAIELYATQSEELLLMLLQRHINLIDDQNQIHFTDPIVAQTVAFYAQLVAGEDRITADTLPGTPLAYRDLADGRIAAMLTPDWRLAYVKEFAPELAGKLAMRSLPVFDATDAPTSTWGGTMIGIPKAARDPAASWRLLQYLCLSHDGIVARHDYSSILPPMPEFWSDEIYRRPDAFFGGQPIDPLYISLAGQIPTRYMTPFSITAQSALSLVLNRAVGYVNVHGTNGLTDACAGWLADAGDELREWMAQGNFDP